MKRADAPSPSEDRSKIFSPSKLDTYKNCPRQYKFKYVDRLRSDKSSIEAVLGTCVHTAFEELYLAKSHGKLLSEAEVIGVFEGAWAKSATPEVILRDKRFTLEDWRNTGLECVRDYYRLNAPFEKDKTVAVEKRIGFKLPVEDPESGAAEEIRIEGYIDRLALAPDGHFEIHDYKTSQSLPTQAQKDADWQLAIYDIAVREAWPDAPGVRLIWHFVRHGKSIVSVRTKEQLDTLRNDIANLVRSIRSDRTFEPNKTPLCDWCDFRELCPLFKHPEAYAKLPEEERRHESGVKLVDQFAELEAKKRVLKEQIAEIENEEEQLEKALLKYGEQHDLRVVTGTDAEVELHVKDELKFPTRSAHPDKVEQMEAELKGTAVWPSVSRLDPKLILEAIREKKFQAAIAEFLKSWVDKWARKETSKSVRLKKKKEPVDD